MLSAAADAFFENFGRPDVQSTYREIIKQCRGFGARRNDIAHGTRTLYPDLGHILVPAYYNSRKYATNDNPAYRYSSIEIDYYEGEFAALIELIRQLEVQVFRIRNETDKARSP